MLRPANNADSDQTGRMPRLICVFAGRTDHFAVSVVPKQRPVDGMISPMIFDSVNVAKCL